MTNSDRSDSRRRIKIDAEDVRVGDSLHTHQDVFWDVVEVERGRRQPDDITIRCVHNRAWTFAADDLVEVLR